MTTRGQDLCFTTQAKKLLRPLSHSLRKSEAPTNQTSEEIVPSISEFVFSHILHCVLGNHYIKFVLVSNTSFASG